MYYSLRKVLQQKDMDGNKPGIILIESNRSDGKTTAVLSRLVRNYFDNKEQCFLIFRYQYELSDCWRIWEFALQITGKSNYIMTSTKCADGLFYELKIHEVVGDEVVSTDTFGFAFALRNPDSLKKYSHLFSRVTEGLFDEFQTETGKYVDGEVTNLQSTLTTIARGGGKHSRYIRLFMCSNHGSLLNPYYIQFGIAKRLRDDIKMLRGRGWILHVHQNDAAAREILENPITKAFGEDSIYTKPITDRVYLHDATVFVETVSGKARYFLTLRYNGEGYGVRYYKEYNIIHISEDVDPSSNIIYAVKASDHKEDSIMLDKTSSVIKFMYDMFRRGNMRFSSIKAKNALFDSFGIDMFK